LKFVLTIESDDALVIGKWERIQVHPMPPAAEMSAFSPLSQNITENPGSANETTKRKNDKAERASEREREREKERAAHRTGVYRAIAGGGYFGAALSPRAAPPEIKGKRTSASFHRRRGKGETSRSHYSDRPPLRSIRRFQLPLPLRP
jgi:hypothetical protein